MPVPQPVNNEIIDELNALRLTGRVLESSLDTARLKRRIESLKSSDPSSYKVMMSAFYGFIGKWDEMRDSGKAAVRLRGDDWVRIFYATTLMNMGFSTAAVTELLETVWDSPCEHPDKLLVALNCVMFRKILDYNAVCKRANLPIPWDEVTMTMIQDAHDILTSRGVEESTVNAMLDIMGQLARERGMFPGRAVELYNYRKDGTLTILQPMPLSADEVAELDWEFSMRLFEAMPDAPADVVHMGFKMAEPDAPAVTEHPDSAMAS